MPSWRHQAITWTIAEQELQRHMASLPPMSYWCIYHIRCDDTIYQSHRYGRHQAACREPAGSYDKTTRTAICFEHKKQYLLIRAPHTRIVVFWHISNIPPWFRRVKLVVIPPRFTKQQYLWDIVIQPAVGCYNSWANLRCSGCYPLGEKLLWNMSIEQRSTGERRHTNNRQSCTYNTS